MKTDERIKQDIQTTETETNTKQLEPIKEDPENNLKIYQDKIYFLVDDFIEREYPGLTQEELKNNKGFFPALIQYINLNYIQGLLHTKLSKGYKEPKYNIEQLNDIFTVYINIVYRYKWNNRPTLIEFSILTGISRDCFNTWINGREGYSISPNVQRIAKSWLNVCENALVDGSGEYVKEIFLLKASHGYQDNNNNITVTHKVLPALTLEQIPDTLGNG